MGHVIEPAASGRAACRGCGQKIAKGELRYGERSPNPFGDGEMTLWFHPLCAAYKRPEPFLGAIESNPGLLDKERSLSQAATLGHKHRRLPRINGAERSPTGRATCRHCREAIAKDDWRIALVYFEQARFEPSGFIHAGCAPEYFETTEIIDRILHFSPQLNAEDLEALHDSMTD